MYIAPRTTMTTPKNAIRFDIKTLERNTLV